MLFSLKNKLFFLQYVIIKLYLIASDIVASRGNLEWISQLGDSKMGIFFNTELAVPLFQIIVLMLFSTMALLFGKVRIALIINYVFTFYWAYIFNRDYLMSLGLNKFDSYTLIYFLFGLIIILVAMVGFLFQKNN